MALKRKTTQDTHLLSLPRWRRCDHHLNMKFMDWLTHWRLLVGASTIELDNIDGIRHPLWHYIGLFWICASNVIERRRELPRRSQKIVLSYQQTIDVFSEMKSEIEGFYTIN